MTLSNNTIIKLADALSADVVEYISNDSRFFDLMVELIPEAICDKLGDVEGTVLFDLSMYISERIRLIGD